MGLPGRSAVIAGIKELRGILEFAAKMSTVASEPVTIQLSFHDGTPVDRPLRVIEAEPQPGDRPPRRLCANSKWLTRERGAHPPSRLGRCLHSRTRPRLFQRSSCRVRRPLGPKDRHRRACGASSSYRCASMRGTFPPAVEVKPPVEKLVRSSSRRGAEFSNRVAMRTPTHRGRTCEPTSYIGAKPQITRTRLGRTPMHNELGLSLSICRLGKVPSGTDPA